MPVEADCVERFQIDAYWDTMQLFAVKVASYSASSYFSLCSDELSCHEVVIDLRRRLPDVLVGADADSQSSNGFCVQITAAVTQCDIFLVRLTLEPTCYLHICETFNEYFIGLKLHSGLLPI